MKTLLIPWAVFTAISVTVAGCASTLKSRPETEPPAGPFPTAQVAAAPFPEVTLEESFGTLGELVRHVGATAGGGLVLMHGLEAVPAPEVILKKASYAKLVAEITNATGLTAQQNAQYFYLYSPAPVYEPLLGMSLAGQLPEHCAGMNVQAAFGGGTALYNVFASLSKSLGITLLADNVISDIPCGELTLPNMPLPTALEAIFKSALLPPDRFQVEATEEYILVQSSRTAVPAGVLLNSGDLDAAAKALLDKRVDIEVPMSKNSETVFFEGASPLHEILGDLSAQLGVNVTSSPALQNFPVTWTVMHQVRVQTALELLIRQWPMPRFGFEVRPEGILIREK